MYTPPPDRPDCSRPLRIVAFDGPGGPIPGRPHILLARQPRPIEPLRIALAASGLLDQLGQVFPVEALGRPSLRVVKPEAAHSSPAAEEPASKLKIAGPRRRRSGVRLSDDDPEGAA
jgi:hypothetical protein